MTQLAVLIVEDEAILAAHLASKVKLLGYRVIGPVSCGEEALPLALEQTPDIALLDIRLDGHMDGIETATRLKQLRDIPVIFLTAHSDQETLKRASAVGPFGYILKPFEERDLATQLEITLYKHQAEASLRESEERYRAFVRNSTEGIWRMEFEPPVDISLPIEVQVDQVYRSARLVECNDAMARMYGFSHAEGLMGKTLDFMLPLSEPSTTGYLASIIKAGYRATNLESVERNVFGETVYFLNSMVGIVQDGYLVRMWGTQQNITDRKQAEEALRHSEEQLELISNTVPALISYVNKDLRYVTCNEAYTTWFGLSRKALIGKTMEEVVGEQAWEAMSSYVETAFQGQAVDYETEAKYRHGITRWIHAVYMPHRGVSGEIAGLIIMVTDISAKKRVEAALRESEIRFRTMADSAPVLIWMNGLQGCEFVNRAYMEFIGAQTQEDVAKYDWARFIHEDDRDPYVALYMNALRERAPFDAQFRFRRCDGQYRWMRSFGRPRLTDSGELVGYVGASIDITDIREAQDHLQRWSQELEQAVLVKTSELLDSQERLRSLAAEVGLAEQRERKRIATELHDHLQQMLVFCKLKLGQGKPLTAMIPGCTELIKQVDDVLTEALTYSRTLVAELCPPVLQEFGLVAALKWLGEHMSQRQLRVSVESGQDYLRVPEEQAVLIFQSVRELLINVAKHAGTQYAGVHLMREEDDLRIEVRDSGAGFDVAVVQSNDGSSHPLKFGLFSIRERMKAFGGKLELVTAPGKGTTAILVLPLQEMTEPVAALFHDGIIPSRTDGRERVTNELIPYVHKALTVLLVDDHAMMRQGLRSVLEAHDDIQIVGEASDGYEAIEMADTLRPAVVVMDINMPRLNGIEATTRIKSLYPEIRVIGLSVNAGPNNKEAMLKAGADMLLTKEAAVEELYRGIQKVVPQL